MRYKPKSLTALQVALGGLPDAMHVEARYPESALKVSKTSAATRHAKTVSLSSTRVYRQRASSGNSPWRKALGATACEYRVVSQSEVLVPLTRL
jgi:hypothetical protein